MFQNYHIPRDSLLNKNGDVTPDGKYVSPFKDPNKRFGMIVHSQSSDHRFDTFIISNLTVS